MLYCNSSITDRSVVGLHTTADRSDGYAYMYIKLHVILVTASNEKGPLIQGSCVG